MVWSDRVDVTQLAEMRGMNEEGRSQESGDNYRHMKMHTHSPLHVEPFT